MKKLFFLLVFYYSLFITNYSLSQWLWVNPKPHGNDFNSISFVNNNTGWMFAGISQNYKTTNKGITWFYNNFTGSPTIYISKVYNFDSQNSAYWLGGDSGRLYKSLDSGKTFQLITLPTANTVKNIFFINKNTGYAAALQLYKTTNSGINWTSNYNVTDEIFCMDFINENTGYCVSTNYQFSTTFGSHWYNNFHETTNSGTNWIVKSWYDCAGYTAWAKDVFFKDTNTGLFSTTNNLFTSNNGGYNWNTIGTGGILKKTRNNIFYRTGNFQLQKSSNYGLNWTLISGVSIDASCLESIDSLDFFIGGYYGNFIKTTNAGANWSNYLNSITSEKINRIILNDSNNIFILAGTKIFKSTNSGANFILLDSNAYNKRPVKSLFFINSNLGWIGSDSGRIFKTTNGGINWNLLSVDANDIITLQVLNSGTGYCFSLNRKFFKTTNFGVNWIYQPTNLTQSGTIFNIQFLNNETGYLRRSDALYKSTNGGQQWSIVISGYVDNFHFANPNTGYLIYTYAPPYGSEDRIIKTTNSGINWSVVLSYNYLTTVYCADTNIVYSASLGRLFKSTNSGNNWEQETISTNYIYSVASYKKTLWLGGESGNIIKGIGKVPIGIKYENGKISDRFELSQNYPNPFNPSTNIRYQIPNNSYVVIKVYDILGKEIATLVNEKLKAGEYETSFDGNGLPSGIYFYTLSADGDRIDTKKMLMIK